MWQLLSGCHYVAEKVENAEKLERPSTARLWRRSRCWPAGVAAQRSLRPKRFFSRAVWQTLNALMFADSKPHFS